MTHDEQLKQWVAGNSIHNDEHEECCPDFSCCQTKYKAPKNVREKFRDADEGTRMGMLMHFLSEAISAEFSKNIYIAGQGTEQ